MRKIRVLSESKLMELVEKLVDSRMRESEPPGLDQVPVDDDDGRRRLDPSPRRRASLAPCTKT